MTHYILAADDAPDAAALAAREVVRRWMDRDGAVNMRMEMDDIATAIRAAVAAERERAARVAEAAIDPEYCGSVSEPSEMCQLQCEMYGCGTLRDVAAAIRAGAEPAGGPAASDDGGPT